MGCSAASPRFSLSVSLSRSLSLSVSLSLSLSRSFSLSLSRSLSLFRSLFLFLALSFSLSLFLSLFSFSLSLSFCLSIFLSFSLYLSLSRERTLRAVNSSLRYHREVVRKETKEREGEGCGETESECALRAMILSVRCHAITAACTGYSKVRTRTALGPYGWSITRSIGPS